MFREQLVVHAGLVVETVEISGGNQLDEILIALFVFAEQDQVIGALGAGATIFMMVGRDVHLAADDGFYAVGSGLMIEIGGGEKIAVVRDGDGWHSAPGGFGSELADLASSVQQRVIRVQMKMNEVRSIHAKFILNQLDAGCNSNLRVLYLATVANPRRSLLAA